MREANVRKERITSRSKGAFNAYEWIKEGNGLLASARISRATWLLRKRAFSRELKTTLWPVDADRAWTLIEGLPRASVLLLGYAVEMYLKAGVARAYHSCPEAMLERDLKHRFRHDLVALANEVEFPLNNQGAKRLRELAEFILDGARYPITPPMAGKYADALNARTGAIWDADRFRAYCALARQIRSHVQRIDQDEKNPAVYMPMNIGADGFLIFRFGGNLSPRITYRPTSRMIANGETSPAHIKALLDPKRHVVLLSYWDNATILEDAKVAGRERTVVHSVAA